MKKNIDTIVAAATPTGRGGVAIVRISGSSVTHIASQIIKKTLKPRYAEFTAFYDAFDQAIDEGIALYFPDPHSFTGEDVLELQGHGGPAIVDCLIQRVLELGARLARPGEFSERAFLNNKLDLAQAEAIADLIDAASIHAARNAVRSLQGEFSKKIHALVESMIQLRIYIEAAIDFAEEEIDFLASSQITQQLAALLRELEKIQASAAQGSLLRDGITAVIAGQPNVGKSSLLNQLSGKDSAIVTDIPGTTRDVLREYILIDGMPMHIIDTAGLRESEDRVEQIGIERAHHEIAQADIILCVVNATEPTITLESIGIDSNLISSKPIILIRNKIDLISEKSSIVIEDKKTVISLCAKSGEGIELLKNQIKKTVGFNVQTEGQFSARRRHLDALSRAHTFLINGQRQLIENRAGELLAEDLRQAQLALNEITGEFTSDDLLGRIFSSFCIGK